MKKLQAVFEKDETGYWTVVVRLGPRESVISDGQTMPKARRRLRQALAAHLDVDVTDVVRRFDIEEQVTLPAKADRAVAEYRKAAARAVEAAKALEESRRRAAYALVRLGVSRRDAGDLLGVSGQRVQQLVDS